MNKFPKHYTLHKEEKDHFVVHDARDKKTFKVAKKELHPAKQMEVMRLPKYSEGGDVEEGSGWFNRMAEQDSRGGKDTLDQVGLAESPDVALRDSQKERERGLIEEAPAPLSEVSPESVPAPAPQQAPVPVPAPAPPQAAVQNPAQTPNPYAGFPTVESLNKMQGQYEGAVTKGAQGQMAQNKQIADLYAKELPVREQAFQHYQESMTKYQQMADKLAQDISSQKLDQNRYWNSKDSGSKFSTAIGVMLSGLGQGMSHSSHNMAMEVLQKNIDRDIEMQKTELGKKQSLLSDNLRIQGNLGAAEAATRAQYEALFQGKLSQLTAKTNNPMIMAQAQQQILESRTRMMGFLQPVAQNQMTMQIRQKLEKGDVAGQDPSQFVPYVVPEAQQKEVAEEIQKAQNTKSLAPQILAAFDRGSSRNPVVAAQGQREFEGLINTTVAEKEGTARIAAFESIHKNMTPSGFSAAPGENTARRRTVEEYLAANSSAPMAKAHGIDLSKFNSTSPYMNEEQKMMNWAKANKGKDPRADEVMKRLGGRP